MRKLKGKEVRGLPSMTSALEGGSGKVDKSTDKLRDHVYDKGGEGVKKFEIFMDVIDGSPLTEINSFRVPVLHPIHEVLPAD